MYKSYQCFLQSYKSFGLSVHNKQKKKKKKIDFRDCFGSNFGFPIGKIFSILDLQVILMPPTKLHSIGLLVHEKMRKIDFQDGSHGCHLKFPIGMSLAIFDLQVALRLPIKFQINWPFSLGEEA